MTISPQIIIGPCGGKMAVLPFDEYERMRDLYTDFHDGIDAQEIKKKMMTGEEEAIPSDVVDRLLDGPESRIKIWREYRGLTIHKLAEMVKCSPAYISEIESGKKDGTIKIMKAMSSALKVDLDDL